MLPVAFSLPTQSTYSKSLLTLLTYYHEENFCQLGALTSLPHPIRELLQIAGLGRIHLLNYEQEKMTGKTNKR